MYDELKKSLRLCGRMINADDNCIAYYDGSCERWPVCAYDLMKQAADAIEERCQQVDKFMEEAARLYAKQPKWIPVTERLPKVEEDVLIAATVHTKKGDVRAVTGDFINTAGQWNGASCSWRYEVTHWMPLPEPPKGQE